MIPYDMDVMVERGIMYHKVDTIYGGGHVKALPVRDFNQTPPLTR